MKRPPTPDPDPRPRWVAVFDDDDPSDIRVCKFDGDADESRCVCCVALMGDVDQAGEWTPETLAEWRANAHLIAAAQDLRDALERAIHHAETGDDYDWIGAAERALAKAKGE